MRGSMKKVAVFTLIAGMITGIAWAAPFEELFQLKNISGKCYVKTATDAKFVKAEQNKAYPYGTAVKTAKKGSATIFLSKDNTCVLKANTSIVISEEKNKNNKIIEVNSGNIDVDLDKEFHKSNGLKIVTATGTCKAIGCKFSVGVSSKKKKNSSTFDCEEGKIVISGDDYETEELNDGDKLAVTTTKDNSFTKIEIVKGDINVIIKDDHGKKGVKKTKEGSVIKIWRRSSESGKEKIVTVLITNPDGALQEAITYTVPIAKSEVLPKKAAVAIPAVAAAKKPEPKEEPKPDKKNEGEPKPELTPTDQLPEPPPILGLTPRIKKRIPVVIPTPTPTPTPTPVGSL